LLDRLDETRFEVPKLRTEAVKIIARIT